MSGTVTFPGVPTGPLSQLYVGVFSNTLGVYATRILSPSSPQTFSIGGVPSGTYFLFAVLDNNNNGLIDVGDLSNTNGNGIGSVTVSSGGLTGQLVALSGANVTTSVTTRHAQYNGSNDSYGLNFQISGQKKLPVSVTLISGPNAIAPQDVSAGGRGRFQLQANLASVRPASSADYAFTVTYSDDTSEQIDVFVTDVLDSFPLSLAPTSTGSGGTTPTFTWATPTSPPSPFSYFFNINASGLGGNIWQYPGNDNNGVGFASSTTSLLYNLDSKASQPSLTTGTPYNWSLIVQDANGNQAQAQVSYTP